MLNGLTRIPKADLDLNYVRVTDEIKRVAGFENLNLSNISSANDKVNLALRSNPFLKNFYKQLCFKLSKKFDVDCAQTWGTIRITLPGQKSVPFHIDQWSGHPKNLINVWVPLTRLENTNSLFIVDKGETRKLISELQSANINLNELEQMALSMSEPYTCSNDILIFSNDFLHGSVVNKDTIRISIDFRLCSTSALDGKKIIGQDYQIIEEALKDKFSFVQHSELFGRQAKVLLFQYNDFGNVAHNAQRQICRAFTQANKLEIISEGSEFQGFGGVFPQLELWLTSKEKETVIVMPSVKCVSQSGRVIPHFLDLINTQGAEIYFALENINSSELQHG